MVDPNPTLALAGKEFRLHTDNVTVARNSSGGVNKNFLFLSDDTTELNSPDFWLNAVSSVVCP